MAPRRRQAIDKLPEAFKACKDGWALTNSHEEPVKLMTEDDFLEQFLAIPLKDIYIQIVDSVEQTLKHDNKDVNSSVDSYEALLSNVAIEKIVGYSNQALYNSGLTATDAKEYRKFLALRNLVSRFRCSMEIVWSDFLPYISSHHGIQFMDLGRVKALQSNTRGYPVRGRSGADDDTWMQRKRSLRNISELEKEIYAPSASMFINTTNGVLVVDDELVASRAKDVELKSLSNRKAGKEGPVSDCVSDSLTSVLCGMRLRVKGESQTENVKELLRTLPPLGANDNVRLCFDRGYGKMPFIEETSAFKFNVTTVAATVGSRHPFITEEECDRLVATWDKAVLLHCCKLLVIQKANNY